MVFCMYYTIGWLSSNGNYSSGNPANKLSGFVGALFVEGDYDRKRRWSLSTFCTRFRIE